MNKEELAELMCRIIAEEVGNDRGTEEVVGEILSAIDGAGWVVVPKDLVSDSRRWIETLAVDKWGPVTNEHRTSATAFIKKYLEPLEASPNPSP